MIVTACSTWELVTDLRFVWLVVSIWQRPAGALRGACPGTAAALDWSSMNIKARRGCRRYPAHWARTVHATFKQFIHREHLHAKFFAKLPPCFIGIEARGHRTTRHANWSRPGTT